MNSWDYDPVAPLMKNVTRVASGLESASGEDLAAERRNPLAHVSDTVYMHNACGTWLTWAPR